MPYLNILLIIFLKFSKNFWKFIQFLLIIAILSNCSVPKFAKPKKIDSRNQPVNAKERARQNVEEGRGVSLKGVLKGGKSTNYEF